MKISQSTDCRPSSPFTRSDRRHLVHIPSSGNTSNTYTFATHIWPSAQVLLSYLNHNHEELVDKKRILELGCGLGVVSIAAAKYWNAEAVWATDIQEELKNVEECLAVNINLGSSGGLQDGGNDSWTKRIRRMELDWHRLDTTIQVIDDIHEHTQNNKNTVQSSATHEANTSNGGWLDLILASDVFYNTSDFPSIIRTIAFLLTTFPNATCVTTYQERNSKRCIDIELLKWDLKGVVLDQAYSFDEVENVRFLRFSNSLEPRDGEEVELEGLDSVYLIQISKCA